MKLTASSRERILFHLKTKGPLTAAALADKLELTAVAVRQQLEKLEAEDLVAFEEERRLIGRPVRIWSLTEAGHRRFPEGYAELTVELIGAMRRAFGADALERLVAARTQAQIAAYGERLAGASSLSQRISALAKIRREEGYMAEWAKRSDGSFTLIENHCPICAAAEICQGLCGGELELFRQLLGQDARIEREEHILEGARRCSYRISPRS